MLSFCEQIRHCLDKKNKNKTKHPISHILIMKHLE